MRLETRELLVDGHLTAAEPCPPVKWGWKCQESEQLAPFLSMK